MESQQHYKFRDIS